jgi:hypothetical protein
MRKFKGRILNRKPGAIFTLRKVKFVPTLNPLSTTPRRLSEGAYTSIAATFSTSELDAGERPASRPGCFISGERVPVPTE